jgi:hypothetical protein
MSKIVEAINAMISNHRQIQAVSASDDGRELFFSYQRKYWWSIRSNQIDFTLYYYPGVSSVDRLLAADAQDDWDGIDMVPYNTAEIGTTEARETFRALYTLLKEKQFGMDAVFADIINSATL